MTCFVVQISQAHYSYMNIRMRRIVFRYGIGNAVFKVVQKTLTSKILSHGFVCKFRLENICIFSEELIKADRNGTVEFTYYIYSVSRYKFVMYDSFGDIKEKVEFTVVDQSIPVVFFSMAREFVRCFWVVTSKSEQRIYFCPLANCRSLMVDSTNIILPLTLALYAD